MPATTKSRVSSTILDCHPSVSSYESSATVTSNSNSIAMDSMRYGFLYGSMLDLESFPIINVEVMLPDIYVVIPFVIQKDVTNKKLLK